MSAKYQALYRKWRPMTFDDVVGQEHITTTLKNELITEKIGHAYLFCGTRGTGKTSTAKIFSRAVNCENPVNGEPCNECETCRSILDGRIMDVYEMDAASNNGVEAIRNLREEVIYTPAGCKYKVYIIDEVHMLTIQAFNALLKTLEEPPAHALFILATTEPQKIPQTILSRCRRYDFRRISNDAIAARLKKIAAAENINATEDALELIAELGDGSMRDALSIIDRCSSFGGELRRANVSEIVGIVDESVLFSIADFAAEGKTAEAISELDGFLNAGKDPLTFFEDFIDHLRALLLCKECADPGRVIEKSPEMIGRYQKQAELFTPERLIYGITVMSEYHGRARSMSAPRVAAEIAVIKLIKPEYSSEFEALSARIDKLENIIRTGGAAARPLSNTGDQGAPAAAEKPKSDNKPEAYDKPDTAKKPQTAGSGWNLWPEVMDAVKKSSKKLFMCLHKSEAVRDGNVVTVRVATEFAYKTIATVNGLKYLSDLFSSIAGETLTAKVVFGEQTESGPGASIMDIVNKKEIYGDIIKVKGE